MGRLDQTESQGIPDAYGVPIYYANLFFREAAGDSTARIYGCQTIKGVIVPQYIVMVPAGALFTYSQRAHDFAARLIRKDAGGSEVVH